jgi:hypothetical protein
MSFSVKDTTPSNFEKTAVSSTSNPTTETKKHGKKSKKSKKSKKKSEPSAPKKIRTSAGFNVKQDFTNQQDFY